MSNYTILKMFFLFINYNHHNTTQIYDWNKK